MRRNISTKSSNTPDAVHDRVDLARFINYVMKNGKKSTAEKLVYSAFAKVEEMTKQKPWGF